MKTIKTAVALTAMSLVAACGHSTSDRALSGAGIGAGAGALGGAVIGGNPVAGAVVGGATGAAVGAMTNERDVNLGKPAWR